MGGLREKIKFSKRTTFKIIGVNTRIAPQPPVPPNRQPLNLIRQAIKCHVENHIQTPPFYLLYATVMAILTLYGSKDPADLLSNLLEQEDLQTGPFRAPERVKDIGAIPNKEGAGRGKYYNRVFRPDFEFELEYDIASRVMYSRIQIDVLHQP